ncbi:MAG: hypothetical protein JST92_20330 [Deltaproteobacteria bacterium]|nr:hypothetical protein [Deltaproteobacteria bacterium]
MDPWLQHLRHDLLKRALWPARDLQETLATGDATPGEVRALRNGLLDLRDEAGRPITASTLLRSARSDAPASISADRLDDLQTLVDEAERLVRALDPAAALARDSQQLSIALRAVLALGPAFDALSPSDVATPAPQRRKT